MATAEGRSTRQLSPETNPNAGAAQRRTRMSRFLRILIAITAAVHLPFVAAVAYLGAWLGWSHANLIAWLAGVGGVGTFLWRARAGAMDRKSSSLAPLLVDTPNFVHWCACVWTMLPAAGSLAVFPVVEWLRGEPFAWPLRFYFWTYVLGLVVCSYGILIRRKWFVVTDVEVKMKGLDPRFDGFTIAHLSDLHIGTMTPKARGRAWTRAANARKPDIAVVTGDMVTSGTAFHEDIAEVVASLEAKNGVFVSMGNHDYFGDGEPLISLLRARGVQVLRNEGTLLARESAGLYLAGIDDTWTKRDDMGKALTERPKGVPAILLAHDPDRFPQAVERGVELTLSGHTHGGQIAFPFFFRQLSLARIAHRFNVGVYREGSSWLYVHPGLGTTGPPMRLGVAPAVVILTLRAG
jgi:predicted MPP superfamily phosphohydrolase